MRPQGGGDDKLICHIAEAAASSVVCKRKDEHIKTKFISNTKHLDCFYVTDFNNKLINTYNNHQSYR